MEEGKSFFSVFLFLLFLDPKKDVEHFLIDFHYSVYLRHKELID